MPLIPLLDSLLPLDQVIPPLESIVQPLDPILNPVNTLLQPVETLLQPVVSVVPVLLPGLVPAQSSETTPQPSILPLSRTETATAPSLTAGPTVDVVDIRLDQNSFLTESLVLPTGIVFTRPDGGIVPTDSLEYRKLQIEYAHNSNAATINGSKPGIILSPPPDWFNVPPFEAQQDLEVWRLELLSSRTLVTRTGAFLLPLFFLMTALCFVKRAKVDTHLRRHSVPLVMIAVFALFCLSVPGLLVRGWDGQDGNPAVPCVVNLGGDVIAVSLIAYFLIIQSFRVFHRLTVNKVMFDSSNDLPSLSSKLGTEHSNSSLDTMSSTHSKKSIQNKNSTDSSGIRNQHYFDTPLKEVVYNVFTFNVRPVIEGDDRTMLGFFALIMTFDIVYITVAAILTWRINGSLKQVYCPFGYEYSINVLILTVMVGLMPYLLILLKRNGDLYDNYGIRWTLRAFGFMASVIGSLLIGWVMIFPPGTRRGESIVRVVWSNVEWQVLSALVGHFLVVILPMYKSYNRIYREKFIASDLKSTLSGQIHDSSDSEKSADIVVVTERKDVNIKNENLKNRLEFIEKTIKVLIPFSSDQKCIKSVHDDKFLLRLFQFVINDVAAFQALRWFSIKDFSVENPSFYADWRKLMLLILQDVTKHQIEALKFIDTFPKYQSGFDWTLGPSGSGTYFFPDQTIPEHLLPHVYSLHNKYITQTSPHALHLPENIFAKIEQDFLNHQMHQTHAYSETDLMSLSNPKQRIYGVWGPLHIASSSSTTEILPESPLDRSPAVRMLAMSTANYAKQLGSGPAMTGSTLVGDSDRGVIIPIPKLETKALKVSVFDEVKEEVLRGLYENSFIRFLESEEGKGVLSTFKEGKSDRRASCVF